MAPSRLNPAALPFYPASMQKPPPQPPTVNWDDLPQGVSKQLAHSCRPLAAPYPLLAVLQQAATVQLSSTVASMSSARWCRVAAQSRRPQSQCYRCLCLFAGHFQHYCVPELPIRPRVVRPQLQAPSDRAWLRRAEPLTVRGQGGQRQAAARAAEQPLPVLHGTDGHQCTEVHARYEGAAGRRNVTRPRNRQDEWGQPQGRTGCAQSGMLTKQCQACTRTRGVCTRS